MKTIGFVTSTNIKLFKIETEFFSPETCTVVLGLNLQNFVKFTYEIVMNSFVNYA